MIKKCVTMTVWSGAALLLLVASGCTSRGMTVTSEPPGAEVSINRRVVGETPIRVGFTHYGTYRIELRKYGYQVLVRDEKVNPPIYGYDPVAAVADNVLPTRLNDEVYLHYVLKSLDVAGVKAAKSDDEKPESADSDSTPPPKNGGNAAKSTVPKSDAELLASRSSREQAEKSALLDRAVAARSGQIIHPKTHEQVLVAIGPETTKKAAKPSDTDVPVSIADTYSVIGPSLTPMLELPQELGAVKPITESAPQGPMLAKEFGLEPEADTAKTSTEKTGAFSKPDEPKKVTPVVRTPKDEELIYDQPAAKPPDDTKKK
jgi:hypothetical protein